MFLFIARHAWAYEFGNARWRDDSQRELEPEGAKRYAKMVMALADRGFTPDVIATSPYARCRQTADLISRYTPNQPKVTELAALQPGSDFEELVGWSRATRKKKHLLGRSHPRRRLLQPLPWSAVSAQTSALPRAQSPQFAITPKLTSLAANSTGTSPPSL